MNEKTIYRGYSYTIEQDADYIDGPTDWTTPTDRAEAIINYALSQPRAGHHPVKASALHK